MRARLARRAGTLAWLAVLWVLLWGSLSPAVLVSALVVAPACLAAARLPAAPRRPRARWARVPGALARFAADLVSSSVRVAAVGLRRSPAPRSAVVALRVPARASDLACYLAASRLSLVPGTQVVDLDRTEGRMHAYLFDARDADGLARARCDAQAAVDDVLTAMGEVSPAVAGSVGAEAAR